MTKILGALANSPSVVAAHLTTARFEGTCQIQDTKDHAESETKQNYADGDLVARKCFPSYFTPPTSKRRQFRGAPFFR
jgi:hypothetical protein